MVRVLVVNDDPDLLMMVKIVLESAGFEVEIASEGRAVEATMHRFDPEILVLDWVLEDTTGGEVLTHLDGCAAGRPRVLVISALDRVAPLAKILGAEAFLRKPFTAEELIEAVKSVGA
jgi:DNA-binding response OmpR family regulator